MHFVLFSVLCFSWGEKYGDKKIYPMCFMIFVEEKMHESPQILRKKFFLAETRHI
jgi:hypothetical protein